ncbi:MBL fold metallo-hydrolase [Arcobacter cryaerophilus gv. pseudocryaerophilus]|uniref:MBL fold metallo-hydrolase n=3 Tax=unclassified Arcobacter TaxID=2593671 RepID=A0AA96L668_9BACT|nr:MBL fold metallo-hydrolase [Arcobacter sp. AZ-2023]WPD05191.1 MBL fold metallo-hydrolase [Arcobacter sp. DSM 115956]WPD07285.1 MBL fold metallo-hydrolase [Arcobacter sp. DSM 115955]WNL31550.1 MBL fold metallo-hydrolase [Arcobacter sp. AZ-2023]WNP37700.1 MBL fold metallo-hydrolase [Arcobacter sp. AZ-2023]
MIFEKFIDNDLGLVSYIVGCETDRDAFIVDPRRDIKEYVDFIEKNGLTLKYVFNTHTHADYIGGHLEIASKYDVDNIFQISTPIENFDIVKVKENEQFCIGSILKVTILETPGHTPFDISLLVSENGIDKSLFTGDFLFVGDIGRPDLLGEENLQSLANSSYESANKLWNLSNDIMIFASHIKGSLCGKNLSRQYFSTIGIEKQTNCSFKLCKESKEKYIENITSLDIEIPKFFKKMAGVNIVGPRLVKDIFGDILEVSFEDIKEKSDIQIIDLREPKIFHKNHIKGSVNICENSNVSLIAGNILDYEKDIYIIGGLNSRCDEFITKLLRVGLDNIKGIVNSDFSLIEGKYLITSNIVSIDEINDSFTNILLDKDCSSLGNVVQSNISKIRDIDLSSYNKVIFSCNYGYKSSAIFSAMKRKNIFWNI